MFRDTFQNISCGQFDLSLALQTHHPFPLLAIVLPISVTLNPPSRRLTLSFPSHNHHNHIPPSTFDSYLDPLLSMLSSCCCTKHRAFQFQDVEHLFRERNTTTLTYILARYKTLFVAFLCSEVSHDLLRRINTQPCTFSRIIEGLFFTL